MHGCAARLCFPKVEFITRFDNGAQEQRHESEFPRLAEGIPRGERPPHRAAVGLRRRRLCQKTRRLPTLTSVSLWSFNPFPEPRFPRPCRAPPPPKAPRSCYFPAIFGRKIRPPVASSFPEVSPAVSDWPLFKKEDFNPMRRRLMGKANRATAPRSVHPALRFGKRGTMPLRKTSLSRWRWG